MRTVSGDLAAAPRRRVSSPLRTGFFISRRAYDLAGGHAPLLDLFASRLQGFYRERQERFEVLRDDRVWAIGPGGAQTQCIRIFRPRDLCPPVNVEAQLETWDSERCVYPTDWDLQLNTEDPLMRLRGDLAALVAAWPETAPRLCARVRRPKR